MTAECQTERGVEFPARKTCAISGRLDDFWNAQDQVGQVCRSRPDRHPAGCFL